MSLAEAPDFATVLKRLRMASGLSQEALAERAAVSTQADQRARMRTAQIALPEDRRPVGRRAGLRRRAPLRTHRRREHRGRTARADRSPGPRNGNLPAGPRSDRRARRARSRELDAALRRTASSPFSVPGGIGKTTLALEAARRAGRVTPTARTSAISRGSTTGRLIAGAIAAARDVRLRSDADPAEVLAPALRRSDMLLVLDNCEHLVEDAARIAAALLRTCPKLAILATSRQRLAIAAETTFRPPPLQRRCSTTTTD